MKKRKINNEVHVRTTGHYIQTTGHCIQRPAWNKEGGLYSCGFNLIFGKY